MADKVDMSEVIELAEKVQEETSGLTESFSTLETRARSIVDMNSFSGFAAMDLRI